MIYSIKRDQFWSFWYQERSNHQDQEILWENTAVEATEAAKSTEVFKAWKITNEDFRVIQVLELIFGLMFWKQKFWGAIMKSHAWF